MNPQVAAAAGSWNPSLARSSLGLLDRGCLISINDLPVVLLVIPTEIMGKKKRTKKRGRNIISFISR
jgi:hypothetical protein